MIQEILTYITVSAAIAYTLYGLWRICFPAVGKSACSGGCSSGCDTKSLIAKTGKHAR
jgi:hypothetical protein